MNVCTDRSPSIFRTSTKFAKGAYIASRDDIVSLQTKYDRLWLLSDSKLFSDNYLQTSFAGFFINNIVNPLVAFSFGLSESFVSSKITYMNIPFDVINIDTHNGWNISRSTYAVQVSGLYVISYTLAAVVSDELSVELQVNQNTVTRLFIYIAGGYTGDEIEILSKTLILALNETDRIAVVALGKDHSRIYSDSRFSTSIKGFLYKPYRIKPVSWRVATHKGQCTSGPLDPVQFNAIYVNEGSGWNTVSNHYVVPLPGVYYLLLSAGMCDDKPTKMELMINGSPIINIYRQFTKENLWDTRSRAIILRLQQGDKLHIRLPFGYYLWTTWNNFTEFGGFRLYE